MRSGDSVPEPIAQHGIKIAGENPMIILYRPGSDDIVVLVSMWTARYSPVGSGRALLIWADPGDGGIRTPNLLIRRSRPRVRTGPAGLAFTLRTAVRASCASVIVQSRLCDLAPRLAPASP